ncbi:hypothetical protein AALB39_09300 [Lachnospiraceae bacterium 54-53]
MPDKTDSYGIHTESETERQRHIRQLRDKLNAPDIEELHPFSIYKIITYLCVLCLPLVPLALFRIWSTKSDFIAKERGIWTTVILVIAVYMVKISWF